MERLDGTTERFDEFGKLEKPVSEDATEKKLRLLLEEGPNICADDTDVLDPKLPDYYDNEKFCLGQRVFKLNVFAMMISKLAGLLTLLAVPSILDILIFTKQSGTPCAAFRRYASTILHTCLWYDKPPSQKIEFFESLKNVRRKHCVASRRSFEAGIGRISQLDMALTQFGFMGFTLLCDKRLGIVTTAEEMEGLVHFWRVIGRMLGVEERFNICSGTAEETRALCRRLLEDIFLPNLANKSADFDRMGRVLLEGLWPVNPFIDNDAFTAFTMDLATSAIPNNNHSLIIDTSKMSRYSRFILNLQNFVHLYLLTASNRWSFVFRAFFNAHMKIGIFLTEKFPFLAYWLFATGVSGASLPWSRTKILDCYKSDRIVCNGGLELRLGYGIAMSLAIFEAKRFVLLALELFVEWQMIRFAGGYRPVFLTFVDIILGFPCALGAVYATRKCQRAKQLSEESRKIFKYLLFIISVCMILNVATMVSIGYYVSVKQRTLASVFNSSMHLYVNETSNKYAVDQIQFVLQCCGHTSYTDWFYFDWQLGDYASRDEMSSQERISDEIYRDRGVPFSCCKLRVLRACAHLEITDEIDADTVNVEGCSSILSNVVVRVIFVAYAMTTMLVLTQALLAFFVARIAKKSQTDTPLSFAYPNSQSEISEDCSSCRHLLQTTCRSFTSDEEYSVRNKHKQERFRDARDSTSSQNGHETARITPSLHIQHTVPRNKYQIKR